MIQLYRHRLPNLRDVLFSHYDGNQFDNLLGIGKKGKAKKEAKAVRKAKDHERKDLLKDEHARKKGLKNDMRAARVDSKNAKTAAMNAPAPEPDNNPVPHVKPKKKNKMMLYAAAGAGVLIIAAGAMFIMNKKPASLNVPHQQPGFTPVRI